MNTGDNNWLCPLSHDIWRAKYQYRDDRGVHDHHLDDTWQRIARALAEPEGAARELWATRFHELLRGFDFVPGGRILAGAGTDRNVTLFNCFVMGVIEDSMDGIFSALREGAITMQQGGGVGYDFSTLRPAGTRAHASATFASGPVSFMRIWDSTCATLLSTGARRGAMMATLRCDHPDIEQFVTAKYDQRELRHFNLSVLVSDALLDAVENDDQWPLVFPLGGDDDAASAESTAVVERQWPGFTEPVPCRVLQTVSARVLWDKLMRAAYDCAEPGVLFIDRINRDNPLSYAETISATNPCGEVPLPPYGACNLGSLNLTRFVHDPFTAAARVDHARLTRCAQIAVRLLDNVIDVSRYPFEKQRAQALNTRRIGLGITGLADTLAMLGLHYGSAAARTAAAEVLRTVCHSAYRASTALAAEKGSFPALDAARHCAGHFIGTLPADIGEAIARTGLRNSHLLAIAPTGTISLLANNVSSGIEPIYGYRFQRRVLDADGHYRTHDVNDYAWAQYKRMTSEEPLPAAFVTALELEPAAHLEMQAALQPYVDQAISKTINVREDIDLASFRSLYRTAHAMGLKGCTTFRPNPVTGQILSAETGAARLGQRCGSERECD